MLAAFLREPDDRYTFRQSLGRIWRIRSLRYLIFANATFGFALFGLVFFLPTFFERSFGLSVEQAGAVQALIALGTFIGTWFGGPIADRNMTKGFGHLCRIGAYGALVLAISWPLAFAIGIAPITITLLSASALVIAASRHAEEDVATTISDFLAEMGAGDAAAASPAE